MCDGAILTSEINVKILDIVTGKFVNVFSLFFKAPSQLVFATF